MGAEGVGRGEPGDRGGKVGDVGWRAALVIDDSRLGMIRGELDGLLREALSPVVVEPGGANDEVAGIVPADRLFSRELALSGDRERGRGAIPRPSLGL